jgi:drug/metabolite transporter (DMT)-like permease
MAKLNFWQWLGVVLFVIGVAWFIYNKSKGSGSTQRTTAEPPAAVGVAAPPSPTR